jgi:hypothetical protein
MEAGPRPTEALFELVQGAREDDDDVPHVVAAETRRHARPRRQGGKKVREVRGCAERRDLVPLLDP